MSTIYDVPTSIKDYLDGNRVRYMVLPHRRDYSAQRTAADTFTPGREFAKPVLLWVDNYYALAVLPADKKIDFGKLRDTLAAAEAGLARESEIRWLFPDCECGAEPPFGNLYGIPVLVAAELADDETITFNGGTHEDVIRMKYADFERLVDPAVLDFACKA